MKKILRIALFTILFIGMQLVNPNVALAETIYCPDTETGYDSDGELFYEKQYTYNKYGQVTMSEEHYSGKIEVHKYKYSDGKLISETTYKDGEPYAKYKYSYDSKERNTRKNIYVYKKEKCKWELYSSVKYNYFSDGKLKKKTYDSDGDWEVTTYKYDSLGRLAEENQKRTYWDSEVYYRYMYTYYNTGDDTSKVRIVSNKTKYDYGYDIETVIEKSKYAKVLYYNSHGDLVRECFQDKQNGKWKTIEVEKTKYNYYKNKYIKSIVDPNGYKTVYSGFKKYKTK